MRIVNVIGRRKAQTMHRLVCIYAAPCAVARWLPNVLCVEPHAARSLRIVAWRGSSEDSLSVFGCVQAQRRCDGRVDVSRRVYVLKGTGALVE
jgi:hypothetical protein